MRFVLDTSALFAMQDLPDGEVYATPGVVAELKKYEDPRLRFWEDLLKISAPSPASLKEVKRSAQGTGDDARLSPTDMEVLALAKDLNATLLTDDYSIQNLAKVMGVKFQAVGMKGIKEVIRWTYRCTGCRRVWDKNYPDCPVCGSPLKSSRSRK